VHDTPITGTPTSRRPGPGPIRSRPRTAPVAGPDPDLHRPAGRRRNPRHSLEPRPASEAGHNASDFIALGLSWFAVYPRAVRRATKTFGWRRAGVLAALANSATLVVVAFSSFMNLQPPAQSWQCPGHDGYLGRRNGLRPQRHHRLPALPHQQDVNLRSAFLHQFGDALSTAAVIAAAVAIVLTGHHWIDAALSLGIAVLILWSSFGILRETLNILLEGTPRGVSLEKVNNRHPVHPALTTAMTCTCWSIGSETHAVSCHVGIEDIPPSEAPASCAT